MLTIRPDQTKVFEAAALRTFEDRMVEHLSDFAPLHYKILTEDNFRQIIRLGMERANSYGLTFERSIRLYVEMMLLLGSGFDRDPLMPWAEVILADQSIDQVSRIDRLYHLAGNHVDHVSKDYGDLTAPLDPGRLVEQIRELRRERAEVLVAAEAPQFNERFLVRLRQNFTHKFDYVGEQAIRRLISQSMERAGEYNITTERGIAVFIAMMFVLGVEFDEDPQLPWAGATLTDPEISTQNERTDKLLHGAIDCLQRWWA